jgi:hypothetical protein
MESIERSEKHMKKIITVLVLLSAVTFSQGLYSTDSKVSRIEKIYRNLEYNTTSFNDMKQKWIVTDPVFVREVFNKFVVHNALRINGRKPTAKEVEDNAEYIYDGDVFIDLRRRFYDDEVEMIRFFKERKNYVDSSEFYFDPIFDFVSIKDILGEKLYDDLKSQSYAMNDITKSFFDYKPAYNFNIYLHLLEPEVMFWNATTNNRNKYLVSVIGRWGNDRIGLPGWYHPDYIMGFKVAYEDSLVNNKEIISYSGEVGIGVPVQQPDLGIDTSFNGRKLQYTGTPFYLRFVGKPFQNLWSEIADWEVQTAFIFSVGLKKAADFNYTDTTRLYSTRNYFDIFFKKNNIGRLSDFGNLSAGFGVSAFDTKYYQFVPGATTLSVINGVDKNGFKYALNTEATLSNEGSVLSHSFTLQLNYNFSEKIILFGVKFSALISNTIGFDIRIVSPILAGAKVLPAYRSDTYLVFSPIIRINY